MRAGPLRSAPLAGLVSAHHAVHAGPCSVIRVASAWRKKLQTHRCGSAYPNCAICSPRCYGAGGAALSPCCIGPSGEDDINSELCVATIESADRLCPHSIYNCSTRKEGTLRNRCRHRPVQYLNNILEQDHRAIKRRVNAKQGFREFQAARRTIQGYEAIHMIRKGQVRWLAGDDLLRQIQFIDSLFDLAA